MTTVTIPTVASALATVYNVTLTEAEVLTALKGANSPNATTLAANGKLNCASGKSFAACVNAVYDAHRVAGVAKLPKSDAKWNDELARVETHNRSEGAKAGAAKREAAKPKAPAKGKGNSKAQASNLGEPSTHVKDILTQAKAMGAKVVVNADGTLELTF